MSTDLSMRRLEDFTPSPYTTPEVQLTFRFVEETRVEVEGVYHIRKNTETSSPLILDKAPELTVEYVQIDGVQVPYETTEQSIILSPEEDDFLLQVATVLDPTLPTSAQGLYTSEGTILSFCEPEYFRSILPSIDHPDNLGIYKVILEARQGAYNTLLSNGNLVSTDTTDDNWVRATFHDPFPKPSYVFQIVAGNKEKVERVYTTNSGREISLQLFVDAGNEYKCDFALDCLERAMRFMEEEFGLECDLDEYKIVTSKEFTHGASENKGLNLFKEEYVLLDPEIATAHNYQFSEKLIGHEYFHNWFGNRVTVENWFNVVAKEGIVTFLEKEFLKRSFLRGIDRIDIPRQYKNWVMAEDSGQNSVPPVVPSFYSSEECYNFAIQYEKGGEIIRMLQTMVGDTLFKKAVTHYLTTHDGKAVPASSFLRSVEAVSSLDLSQFERTWLHQKGVLGVDVTTAYDAPTQEYTITIEQQTAHEGDQPYHFPFSLSIFDSVDGQEFPLALKEPSEEHDLSNGILHIRHQSQSFTFQHISRKPVPSLLRGFSAPVKLTSDLAAEDLQLLMKYDTDASNRYSAFQTILLNEMKEFVGKPEGEYSLSSDAMESFANIFSWALEEPFLAARMLILPSIVTLSATTGSYDYPSLNTLRDYVKKTIATHYEKEFLDLYASLVTTEFPPEKQVGVAQLRQQCLWYLPTVRNYDHLIQQEYTSAKNVEDRLNALRYFSSHGRLEQAWTLFQDLTTLYGNNDTVFCSMIGAMACFSSTEEVFPLLAHIETLPEYQRCYQDNVEWLLSPDNSLLHLYSGEAYTFIASRLPALEAVNPERAARVLRRAFKDIRNVPASNSALMAAALRTLRSVATSKAVQGAIEQILE